MLKINHIHLLISLMVGIGIFAFFFFIFPHHLHFQEQFQLFLFTDYYFLETCSRPGGFSNYAGRFLTQFFISEASGALILSLMLIGIQQLVYAICRRFKYTQAGWFLSFFPAFFYWYLLFNENTQQGGIVATLFMLLFTLLLTLPKSNQMRRALLIFTVPVLYWIAGGVVIPAVIILLCYEWIKIKQDKKMLIPVSFIAVFLTAACPFIAKQVIIQYPFERLFWGVDYMHSTIYSPVRITYLWIFVLIAVILAPYLPKIKNERIGKIIFPLQAIIILFIAYIGIGLIAYPENRGKEEIMAYDYYCRMKKWDKIIKMADRKSPTVPMTVTCLNLALYKTGQLPEKMFNYFQNGPEGLLPTFQRVFMISAVSAEPYYYLGFINFSQRLAFEAMEALPDYQKSARSIKRLVETNLINGNYEVAKKYLNYLDKTLFYRKWAKVTRSYLYDEDKINAHPEFGELRRIQVKDDFLYSGSERDVMLAVLFQQNRDNRMAYEYLLAHALLNKDIKNFPVFYNLQKDFSYNAIPKSYQEALIYIWGLSNDVITGDIPFHVDKSVLEAVKAYANIYTSSKTPEPLLKNRYSNTFWYYLHFKQFRIPEQNTSYQY